MDLIFAALGLIILLLAGDSLVRGAVNLSLRLGVPALIVSLTIVAFGTSAPELLISIGAIMEGVPGLAMGNVVGSNTANILLVLGVPALMKGLSTGGCDTRKSYLQMMAATVLFTVLCLGGVITWVQGLVLLAALALMLSSAFKDALCHRRDCRDAEAACADDEDEVEGADPNMPWWKVIMFLVLGLIVGRGSFGRCLNQYRAPFWRIGNGDWPDAGGAWHFAAGTCHNRYGRPAQSGRGRVGQRHRVEYVQPACDHRHLVDGGTNPGRAGDLTI